MIAGNPDELLDNFAHELAEKQREWAKTFGETPTQQALRSIINESADLIDPEVSGV
jgi:hypothetical protein